MTQSGKHYSNDFPVFATDYVHWPKRIEGAVLASDQFYQYPGRQGGWRINWRP